MLFKKLMPSFGTIIKKIMSICITCWQQTVRYIQFHKPTAKKICSDSLTVGDLLRSPTLKLSIYQYFTVKTYCILQLKLLFNTLIIFSMGTHNTWNVKYFKFHLPLRISQFHQDTALGAGNISIIFAKKKEHSIFLSPKFSFGMLKWNLTITKIHKINKNVHNSKIAGRNISSRIPYYS